MAYPASNPRARASDNPTRAYATSARSSSAPLARGCLDYLTRGLLVALILAIVLVCLGALTTSAAYAYFARGLPSPEELAGQTPAQSTRILARDGTLLYEVFDPTGGKRTIVPNEKISLVMKQAIIATEDPTFYSNPGVDFYGVLRAIYYDVRYQRAVVGGSTITQQLVKNTLLTPEPTIARKIREAILAWEVTQHYSKDQILAFYLNTIFFGNLAYGIQSAAQTYFDKDVSQLDLAEASLLAGLPQAPALYDPCSDADAALARQRVVLDLMQKERYITAEEVQAAADEMGAYLKSANFAERCTQAVGTVAPHFVAYVRQLLEQEYGTEMVYKGGLVVTTTLDLKMQSLAEKVAREQINSPLLKGKNVTNAALVALNPKTGEIYAMLGSVDFFDKDIDGQVNVALRLRQPGSSIKPINYVTAFEKGWNPATVIVDVKTEFPNGNGRPPYAPVNYDGKEHGLVSARVALASSLNIPAVKTLYFTSMSDQNNYWHPVAMVAMAERMGITTFTDIRNYGLALTLGGGDVKLLELTGAYAVFANEGKRVPPTPFLKIAFPDGHVEKDLQKNPPKGEQVLDPRLAFLITSILSDNDARALAFGLNSVLKLPRPAAVKTGTTDDFRDNWTIGYTPALVVGVWVGNANNSAMKGVSGVTGAAPIWHNFMEQALAGTPAQNFQVPAGLVIARVCKESGLLASENCPPDHQRDEYFIEGHAPAEKDTYWQKIKIDKTNNLLANDQCPPDLVEERVFQVFPHDPLIPDDRLRQWASDHGFPQPPTDVSPNCTGAPPPPEATDTPSEPTNVQIAKPRDNQTVSGTVNVVGSAQMPDFDHFVVEVSPVGQVQWTTPDKNVRGLWTQIAAHNQPVADGVLAQWDTRTVPDGNYAIRVIVSDRHGRQVKDRVEVRVDNTPNPTRTPRPTRTPKVLPTPTEIVPVPTDTSIPPTKTPHPTPTETPPPAPTDTPPAPTDTPPPPTPTPTPTLLELPTLVP